MHDLAQICAEVMLTNKAHGMPCEPDLVFFQCQNHVHCAFQVLKHLSNVPSELQQLMSTATDRWERSALQTFKSPLDTAAFSILAAANDKKRVFTVPFGTLGSDGWCLNYYVPWAASGTIPLSIWERFMRPTLYDAYLSRIGQRKALPPPTGVASNCCLGFDVPESGELSFAMASAAMVGDSDSALAIREALLPYLRREPTVEGLFMQEGVEWSFGCTAHYLLGLAHINGSSLRELVRIPRQLLGPQVTSVQLGSWDQKRRLWSEASGPEGGNVSVFRAHVRQNSRCNTLELGIESFTGGCADAVQICLSVCAEHVLEVRHHAVLNMPALDNSNGIIVGVERGTCQRTELEIDIVDLRSAI